MDKNNWHLKENLWRPVAGENRIRIAPSVTGSGTTAWWMRVDIHHIPSAIRSKKLVCNAQPFKKPCSLCEMKRKFKTEGEVEEAESIGLWKYTFLNIIDRANEDGRIKVWMAPISAWWQIARAVFRDGDVSLIMDSPRDGTYGCDLLVYYDPDEKQYGRRYKVSILRSEPKQIGTTEQVEKWIKQLLPLKPENFYTVVDELETQFVESSIRAWVKRRQEFEKREPLFRVIHGRCIPFEQVKKANRILQALDGWTVKKILKEEHKELQSFLGSSPTYDEKSLYWAVLLQGKRAWERELLIDQKRKEREQMIKIYTDTEQEKLEATVKNPEEAYKNWLKKQENRSRPMLMKLSIMEAKDRYIY